MDYIFYETMKNSELQTFVISYDIVCQWSVNLRQRMMNYIEPDPVAGSEFFLYRNDTKTTFLVPKFHLPAHISKCRTQFSFNLTKNVGRTEGEAPERGWVGPNALAPSTKEMGPGSCRDTLDFHFGDANHKKVIGMGKILFLYLSSDAILMLSVAQGLVYFVKSWQLREKWQNIPLAISSLKAPSPRRILRNGLLLSKLGKRTPLSRIPSR